MKPATRFEFRWARPEDEADIRALVGSVPMPGAVAVRFAREPDYFLGATTMGDPCEVLIARQRSDGALAGIACRAEHQAYVNGQEARLGYIGQIRVAPSFRGQGLVRQGVKWFQEASPSGLLYMGVIAGDNPRARNILVGEEGTADNKLRSREQGESARDLAAGPHIRRISGLTTYAILLRPRRISHAAGIEVQPGSPQTLGEIVEFLQREGPRRQFFPAYTLEDFSGEARLRGLRPQDIYVARRTGEIVGVMAAWDQSAYKQDIVEAYGPSLQRLRPAYDLAARVLGAQPLTPPGQAIPLAFAACVCIAGDNPSVMRVLLAACCQSAYQRSKAFLMLGLADEDPLLAAARQYLHITYRSDLFAVSWSAEPVAVLDSRLPYIEIATL